MQNKMGRSKFPGKPSKLVNKKRVSVLQGSENSDLHDFSEENSEYLLGDQVSFGNSRNETTTFGHDGAVQATSVPQSREKPPSSEPPDGGGDGGRRFQSVIKIDKPFNSGISTRSSLSSINVADASDLTTGNITKGKSDPDKPKKKTVTFKTILETSDDASAVKKVYNPDNHTPLVPIIKKECLSRFVRLARSDCIVRPSRLTDILKNNANNIDKLNALSFKITTANTTIPATTITDTAPSCTSLKVKQTETNTVPCLSTLTSSSVTSLNNETDSIESKKSDKSHHDALVVGDKRFILPKRSVHSCRVIKPNKRFLDDMDTTVKNIKKTNISGNNSKKVTNKQTQEEENVDGDSKCQKQNRSIEIVRYQGGSFLNTTPPLQTSSSSNKLPVAENNSIGASHPKLAETIRPDDSLPDCSQPEGEYAIKNNLFAFSTSKNFGSLFCASKSILRQPRLQFDLRTSTPSFITTPCANSSFGLRQKKAIDNCSTTLGVSSICGVCGSLHTSVQKTPTFDIFACEACRKFITKTIKRIVNSSNGDSQTNTLQCSSGNGSCSISPVIGNKYRNIKRTFKERCHACWLKKCLKTFNISSGVRKLLTARLPASLSESENCISPFSNSSVGSSKENLTASTTSVDNKSSSNLFSSSCSNLINWSESVECNNIAAQLPSNALTESNATFGGSPLIKPTVLEKRVFSINSNINTPNINESDKKNVLDGTKSVINVNNDLKSVSSVNEEESNKSKQKRVPVASQLATASNEAPKRQRIDLKGPRVKHVCRSASIVLGQPLATFENEDEAQSPEDEMTDETLQEPTLTSVTANVNEADLSEHTSNLNVDDLTLNCTSCTKVEISKVPLSPPANASEEETVESSDIMKKSVVDAQKSLTRKISRSFNSRKNSQKGGNKRSPVTISIDFWENYDPAEVSQTGFGLILTESISIRALCFLCGSAGVDPLIFCACCCEPYHQYCVEDEYNLKHSSLDDTITSIYDTSLSVGTNLNAITSKLNWLCPRCTVCYTCNMSSGSKVKCQKCQKNYHTTCLGTSKRLLGADRPLICANCLKCKSCATTKVTKFVGNLPLCSQCFKLRKKGNYCPICQKCYEDNDFDLKMMECGDCERWVHAKCEGLSDEQYNMLSTLPENIEFICRKCSETNTQSNIWREAVAGEFKSGLLSVVKLLSKSRQACALLKLSPRKKTSPCICQPIQANRNIQFSSSSCDYRSFDEESQNSDDNGLEDVYEFKESPPASVKKCFCGATDKQLSNVPSLIDIKRKINACEYVSVAEFNYDMINVISAANCDELVITYKEILSETFPWFQNETKACTDLLEEDMFDSCSFTQNSEVECDQQVPVIDLPGDIEDCFYGSVVEQDSRSCMLCKGVGEGISGEESRLIYCGQNFWVHINCALWSAEVFEEIDGSLQNVHSAISRGRLIKCTLCGNRGATVGCNVKSCGEHFHYPCARKAECSFLTDKTVYCPQHVEESLKKKNVESEKHFNVQRPVYVELDRKKKKLIEPSKVQFLIGSLVVKKLGSIFPKLSDTNESLIPIDFSCTRLYWSIKEPWKIVEYTVKTSIQNGALAFSTDYGRNFTVDHSNNVNLVQIGLAQIARWHNSLIVNDENDMFLRQERSMKQLLEAVSQNYSADDATEEEPQNNADLLPPEIKEAIFEDLPHELLDGISMLDIFPKLMIYEDMINLDSKAETLLSNECTKDGTMSEEDGNEPFQKDGNAAVDWPVNLGFNHVEDAMLSAARPICSSREIKRSKSEVFQRSLGSNRSQQRSSSLTFNCKIDGTSGAKRRKLSKGFQDIRIPESVLLSIGRRKDDIPILERHRTMQSEDIKTKTFNWSAAKKYSSSTSAEINQESTGKVRDVGEKLKISQLDGMDDLMSENEMLDFHQDHNIYEQGLVDCPVKCDRCNCTYRTQESYQRHLATCESLSTSESESESARSPPIQSHHMLLTMEPGNKMNGSIHQHPLSLVQNLNQSSLNAHAVLNPLPCSTPTSFPMPCNSTTQSIHIQSLQNTNIPITQINQGVSNIILTNTQQQPQQQSHQFFPLQSMNGSTTVQLLQQKNEVPTVSMSTVPLSSVQAMQNPSSQVFTMPASNGGTQQIVTIAPQQATLITQPVSATANPIVSTLPQPKLYRVQNEKSPPKSKPVQLSPTTKLRPKVAQNIPSKPIQMKKVFQRTDSRPISIVNESIQTPGLILQPNTNTQPIIVQQMSNGPHNIMSYVTDGHSQPVQYLAVPSATDFKPQAHNAFITPANPLMQGAFIQTDSSGNLLLTNASAGLQMLSATPLQIAQQAPPQVIGTLIQPQSGAVQCGMMSAEQMVLGPAPALEMVANPTMLLASQPVYYGLETIVQNTVMSSQQFVSTAMQGVLSQNASFSATTTQVFQASKIEPIMEMPNGYVVLNNVDGTTIMQQPATQSNIISANVLQQPLTQLQTQSQPIQAQVQAQQIGSQSIYNIQQHHSQPQQTSQCIVPQQIQAPKMNTLSPVKPTAKSTPIVMTKIQPQIINKVIPNMSVTNNQIVQDHTVPAAISTASTANVPTAENNSAGVQSAITNKMSKIMKTAPLSVSQQYALKPKIAPVSTANSSVVNIQPVQRKLNLIRPLNKPASVTIKPKIIAKTANQKVNNPVKATNQTPTLIAPKPSYTIQRKPVTNNSNNDKSVPRQFNIALLDKSLSEQNQTSQPVTVALEKGVVSASFHTPTPENNVVTNNSVYQQPTNVQFNPTCTVNPTQPVTSHSSSIQLPCAPFNSPYGSNIPTNIVNPIQQTANNQSNNIVSRPTNRVLPMQTILQKPNSPNSVQKVSETKTAVKEEDLKISIMNVSPTKVDGLEKSESNVTVETPTLAVPEFTEFEEPSPKIEDKQIEEKDNDKDMIDDDFDMKTSCDDITDNDDRSESTLPEVKEKISKILENLDDECNNLNFNQKEQNLDEKYLVDQKENLDPQNIQDMPRIAIPTQKAEQMMISKPAGPHVLYEIQSEDGFTYKSTSITEIWEKVFEAVQIARKAHGLLTLPEGPLTDMCGIQMLGLKTNALRYLIEQLPGAERCSKYTPKYHRKETSISAEYSSDQEELKENDFGAARCEAFSKRSDYDMFSWLASRHRKQPIHVVIQPSDNELVPRRGTGSNLPMAMKYRTLKETYKDYVGVFRSHIHGRGLFCTKDIEAGEMVIEYAGELIRSTLTDKRERYYDSKNIGCYMFKIDDNLVVDATMRGNAARFINHSCEPNCYSKVVDILGHKHIIIFALRRIVQGEELTYDYKFPFEEDKIPCSCRSRKCRKYLN